MRNSLALKTLLRSPVKTLLTFLLIAAASFALFSRITDYAVTSREAANAESFYHGVAALDNTVPAMQVQWQDENGYYQTEEYELDEKPWPTKEQLEDFSSLPGVSLADTRYMTAGLVDGCKRVNEKGYLKDYGLDFCVLEGTYQGCQGGDLMDLMFDDVTVLAGRPVLPSDGEFVKMQHWGGESYAGENPYPESFWKKLKKGSRLLIVGYYGMEDVFKVDDRSGEQAVRVLDGLGEEYLDTEAFAYYKELIEQIQGDFDIYDMVYTSDMRSIPRFNERKMVITKGRSLSAEDVDACAVSELFVETYGLSIGDKISVRLGDRLFAQNPLYGAMTTHKKGGHVPNFTDAKELEIVGIYRFNDVLGDRVSEFDWSYTPSTIFVPKQLLPVEVPDDYEQSVGEFSVFVENARDIEAFKETAEPLAAKMGVALRFSDGGWLSVKDSFETGTLVSFLTTLLYALGAALALMLAVYLYVGRNQEAYAVMRAMGVPSRRAGRTLALPLAVLSLLAVPSGGTAGLIYTSKKAVAALASMTENAPEGYVSDTALPAGTILLCLILELALTAGLVLFFLQRMKKTPPLELLQGGILRAGADRKAVPDMEGLGFIPAKADFTELPATGGIEALSQRKYHAPRQMFTYVLRHMRRGVWKSAVSLLLTAVLASGIGMFVLARITYREAFYQVDVNGTALDFASSSVKELSKSSLAEDFYCHSTFSVRINGLGLHTPMVFTNDADRYLADGGADFTVDYADGYDASVLRAEEPVCLVGKNIAETLDIHPGDEAVLLSDSWYAALSAVFKEEGEKKISETAEKESIPYKVIGIIDSKDEMVNASIFAGLNGPMEELYSQPFQFGYCEFTLSDNRKLDKLERLLSNLKNTDTRYAPMASFYIDSEALGDVVRVRSLLEELFPIAVMATVFIGLAGYGLVILQSAKEAAFLRILGVTKKRARCMLALEQIFLCIGGIVLVTVGLAVYRPGLFARSARTFAGCYALYFMGCACGAFAAAVQVTRHKILELLQVRE